MTLGDQKNESTPAQQMRPPTDPLEIRSNPRVGMDLGVQLYATGFSGALPGRTRDLSISGACLATPSPFNPKDLQRVVIDFPTIRLSLNAIGCWQREDPIEKIVLTGIQFEHPNPDELEVVWDQVLDSGKRLARFLYEKTALHELGLEEAMGLAQVTRYRSAHAGEMIYRQGQQDEGNDSIFLIIEGNVGLQVRVRDAIERPLAQLGVGDLFGGLPLLADLPHAESAIAATPVRLLEVDHAAFRHLRSMKPWLGHRLGVALLRVHAQRMAAMVGIASETL